MCRAAVFGCGIGADNAGENNMYPYSYFQQESSGNAVGGSDGSGGNGAGNSGSGGSVLNSVTARNNVEPAPSVASSTAAVANFPTGNGAGAEDHFFSHPAAFDSGGYRSSLSESLGDFDLNGAGSGYPFFQRPSTSCGSDAGSGGSVKSGFSIMGKKR